MGNRLLGALSIVLIFSSCGPLDETQPALKDFSILLQSKDRNILANPSMTFDLSCTQTFGGSGTFTQNSIVISGTSGTIKVLASTACTLTLTSFFDGTNTFTPTASSLVITITNAGGVSWSGTLSSPVSYVNASNTKVYLFLVTANVSTLSFQYTYDPVVQSVTFVSS